MLYHCDDYNIEVLDFELATLKGTIVEFDPCDGMIDIIKNGERRSITYEQFDDLFFVINEVSDAALKEDCIYYKIVGPGVLLKNHKGQERLIDMKTFLSTYTI